MPKEYEDLRKTLHDRFTRYPDRHPALTWSTVEAELTDDRLRALDWMEQTGGEPDVVVMPDGQWLYVDCAEESPTGRRSLCYDNEALEKRKKNKPLGSAVATASEYGVAVLTEDLYRHLQTVGAFDLKTSSWIETPESIRMQGGALFCDRRYGNVFTYHNGADSYYANRGFRTYLTV
jgi:hypothetical protein